ncbi:MAG: TlpA disulfide reductase family protein, partial [Thermodesulfobacteriota bacterium]
MAAVIRYKFLFLFIVSIFMISCFNQNGNGEDYKSKESNISFNIPSLGENNEYTFESFKGKPTVLNFWASWCVPCREEMPFLEKTWKDLKDKNINIVGINVMDNK